MRELIKHFKVKGEPTEWTRYGHGHINETYLVTCDSGLNYILQKINKNVFKKPEELMENIMATTLFIQAHSNDPRACLRLVPLTDGKFFHKDADGEYWRMYDFVPSTICLQKVETSKDFYYAGLAFGRFQGELANFPAETLHEPIANFHDTRVRFQQLRDAINVNFENRLATCAPELEFALARECEGGLIVDKLESGELPLRVTHNDTKLNNILFDYDTRTPLCVIDLDTIMPGSSLYDYGDSIRFGASTAAEDETDLSKVSCDMDLFRTYTEGFLEGCNGRLTDLEIELLPLGAKMMTLECGIRFLADYLNGDTYFRTQYADHNLRRARTHFRLVADMESKWETMHQIVKECVK